MPMDYRLVLWVSLLVSVDKHASGLLGPLAVLLPKKSHSPQVQKADREERSTKGLVRSGAKQVMRRTGDV